MSKNKGFSNISASRYSLALFELATELNLLNEVEKNSMAFLNLISSNKDFNDLIKDPTINREILMKFVQKKEVN